MEAFDAEVEWALTHNIEPADHIAALTQEAECPECFHPAHKGVCEHERGDTPGDGEHCAMAMGPCGCKAKTRSPANPLRPSPEQSECPHPIEAIEFKAYLRVFVCGECGSEILIPDLVEGN